MGFNSAFKGLIVFVSDLSWDSDITGSEHI